VSNLLLMAASWQCIHRSFCALYRHMQEAASKCLEYCDASQASMGVECDGAQATWLDDGTALVALRSGQLLAAAVRRKGGATELRVMRAGAAPPPSARSVSEREFGAPLTNPGQSAARPGLARLQAAPRPPSCPNCGPRRGIAFRLQAGARCNARPTVRPPCFFFFPPRLSARRAQPKETKRKRQRTTLPRVDGVR
jgi:hypothetical protein